MKKIIASCVCFFLCISSAFATSFTLEELHHPLMGYIDQKYREAIGSAQPDQLLLQDLETDYEFLRSHISLAIQDEIFAGSTVQEALPVILPHIQDFMSLLTLISKLKTSDITEQDVAKVEREVLRYQQDIIGVLRRYLAIPDHDTKEISSFTVDLDSAYVDVYIDSPDIESTVSYERNQFATSIDLDFIVEIHPYFIPAHLKLDGSTAFSIQADKSDIYFSWDSFDVNASGDDVMIEMFQEDTLPELERAFEILNERPLHIETDTSYMFQQAYDPDFFFLLLDILEASPLLTPYTDSPDGWLLEFNEETLAGILSLVDHEVNQYEIDNTQADIRDMGVYMNIKDIRNSHIGIPVDQEDAVGEFTLTRANKNYELTGRVDGVGYAEGNEFEITLREGYASSHLTTFGVEFYSLLWENGYLNFDATDGGLMTFSLAGQFQPDDFHLKAKYNGTSVGYINYEMTGQSATFSMAIDLRDLVSGDFYIELTSESSWNEGRYIITFPATVWSEDEFYEELYK